MNKLKEYFKNQPVEFFAITFNKKEALYTFLENHKLDFKVIHNSTHLIKKFGIPYYPFFILIDKNRKIEYLNDTPTLKMFKKLKRKLKIYYNQETFAI